MDKCLSFWFCPKNARLELRFARGHCAYAFVCISMAMNAYVCTVISIKDKVLDVIISWTSLGGGRGEV